MVHLTPVALAIQPNVRFRTGTLAAPQIVRIAQVIDISHFSYVKGRGFGYTLNSAKVKS